MTNTPSDQSTHWSIHLFGSPRIDVAGQSVAALGDNKEDLLLIYLAVSPEATLPRRTIAQAFWPRRDLDDGLKRLSYTLWLLRRRLEELGIHDAVSTTRATLRLNPSISTDVQEFRGYVLAAATTRDHPEQAQLLRQAINLYNGGLLPSFQFPWLESERSHLEAMHQEAVQALSHALAPAEHVPTPALPWQPSGGEASVFLEELPSTLLATADAPSPSLSTLSEERNRLLEQVERAEEHFTGTDRFFWLSRIDAQYPAIEAALEWAIDTQARTYGLRLASILWRYWEARNRLAEGRWFIERLLVLPGHTPLDVEAKARYCAGALARRQHHLPYAQQQFESALPLWREAGDEIGEMRTLADLAAVAHDRGDYPYARHAYDEVLAIARRKSSDNDLATLLSTAPVTALRLRDPMRARDLLWEGLEVARRAGDQRLSATIMAHLASADLMEGDDADAAIHAREALAQLRAEGDKRGAALALRILGRIAYNRGNYRAAIAPLIESMATAREAKDLGETGETLRCLAEVRHAMGDISRADGAFHQAARLLEAAGDPYGTLKDIPSSARTSRLPAPADDPAPTISVPAPSRTADRLVLTPQDLLGLVQEAEPHLSGGDRATWLERIDAHYDDIRAVLEKAVERSNPTYGLPMATALWRYWCERGMVDEGRWFLEQLLPTGSAPTTHLHAQALHAAGTLAMIDNDFDHARWRLNEALAIWRQFDDDAALIKTLANLGTVAYSTGAYPQARTIYSECLAIARRMGDEYALLCRLHNAALVEIELESPERAQKFLQERLGLAERLADRRAVASALAHLASTDLMSDDHTAAREHASRAAEYFHDLGDQRGEALALRLLGWAAHNAGDYQAALGFYQESLQLAQASGNMTEIGETLRYHAATFLALGKYGRASSLTRQAIKLLEAEGNTRAAAQARELLAEIQATRGGHAASPSST